MPYLRHEKETRKAALGIRAASIIVPAIAKGESLLARCHQASFWMCCANFDFRFEALFL